MTARARAMKQIALVLVLAISPFAMANADESEQIPLDAIWAYNLPGTRDIEELAQHDDAKLLESIFQSWKTRADRLENHDMARPSFAVSGRGPAALRAVHAVLAEGTKPRTAFSPDEEVTIVLFSEPAWDNHVRIEEVARLGDRVVIRYWLEQHVESREESMNLALIPLGKLPVGEYSLELKQLPRKQKSIQFKIENPRPGRKNFVELGVPSLNAEWSRRFLSKPFSFQITTTIPLDEIWAYEMPGTREIQKAAKDAKWNLLEPIFESWWHRANRLKFKDLARPGFAVSGHGLAALRSAHAVFVEGAPLRKEFSTEDEISLVVFSEPFSRYRVQIQQVRRRDRRIEIRYQLQASIADRAERRNFGNFALIPLGKLPEGEYHVELRQMPRELSEDHVKVGFKPLDEEWSHDFLSKPFCFTVESES
jgi:hypothetical protein